MRSAGLALALALLAACAPLPLPRQATFHPSDAELTVTRIVHGSFVLEMHGTRLLLDPWFNSTWVMRQREPLGLTPATLPKLSAVLLTGDDATRFDPSALHDLAATTPRAIVPPAMRERVVALGFHDVTGLAWWDRTDDLLVFGGESRGLPDAIRAAYADDTYGIPIASPHVRSLNLATAVAVVLFEGLRQLGAA